MLANNYVMCTSSEPSQGTWLLFESYVTNVLAASQYLLGARRELAASAGRSLRGGPQVVASITMAGFSSLPVWSLSQLPIISWKMSPNVENLGTFFRI